ncbi:MLP-like protein 28 [Hibiscus trionum]|uniref:MLP-like protein 28 n=1 Tax=Hibiscus trionum TaxID=183268 RepID=A0A9W7GU16_HIBTR|nr:MLP-like protein 28 [Hibiscus trionum]
MASSALVDKLEAEIEIKSSAEQFHDMIANKPHHLHHASNDKIQGCDLLEGEWGKLGSIIRWHLVLEGKARTGKDTVEAIDPDKNSITFRKLEAEILREYKTIVYTIQASPKSEGSGSVVHLTLEYEKLHHGIGHPQALQQFLLDVFTDIDAYLTQPNKV